MYKCPFFETCEYMVDKIGMFSIQLAIIIAAMLFGVLLIWNPKKIIAIQKSLYRRFNWDLEPISMEKELRNTRIMGACVFILGIISLIFVVIT